MKKEIYPQTYKTKHFCYFTDTCSECGALHNYRKYAGWQKRNHITKCFPESVRNGWDKSSPRIGNQLNLF